MVNVVAPVRDRKAIMLPDLLAAFLIVAFPNAIYGRVMAFVGDNGWADGFYSTFGISALIWLGMWMACDLVAQSEREPASQRDIFVVLAASFGVLFPVSGASWIALTVLSLYVFRTRPHTSTLYRAFWIVLALCFSGFWSRQFFLYFMDYIVRLDTIFVSALTGAPSVENLIAASDGKTTLQVQAGCSSFNNISLAFLGWILACSHYGLRGFLRSALFIAMSAAAVVFINTLRIGAIVIWPEQFELIHGSVGSNIVSILTTLAIGAISIAGARK